jgi:hypothetical protein
MTARKLWHDAYAERIAAAYEAGERVATSYKPGDVFLGAGGEADKLGFGQDTMERSVFTTAYLRFLRKPVVTTADLVVIKSGT